MRLLGLELVANVAILFPETSVTERPRRAKSKGFDVIESWWPFDGPAPGRRDVRDFIDGVQRAGVRLAALNMFGGYASRGDSGLACRRERHSELRACLPALVEIASATGCSMFNCPYGQYDEASDRVGQERAAIDVLAEVGEAVQSVNGTVLLEPIFLGAGREYPLRRVEDVLAIIDGPLASRGVTSVGLLCDLFHVGAYGTEIIETAERYAERISHVQIADYPGRHEPGTGAADPCRIIGLVKIGVRRLRELRIYTEGGRGSGTSVDKGICNGRRDARRRAMTSGGQDAGSPRRS